MEVDMRLVWFVLAAFLLGFSISTLWEWLYFRRRRVAALQQEHERDRFGVVERAPEHHAVHAGYAAADDAVHGDAGARSAGSSSFGGKNQEDSAEDDSRFELIDDVDDDSERWRAEYQGPGVYLDSEDDADAELSYADTGADTGDIEPDDDGDDEPDDFRVEEPRPGPKGQAAAHAPFGAATDSPAQRTSQRIRAAAASGFVSPSPASTSSTPAAPTQSRPGGASSRPAIARTTRPARPDIYSLESNADSVAAELYEIQGSEAADAAPVAATPSGAAGTSVADGARTPSPLRKTTNYPDELAKIKGIGEVYKLRLYAAGIYTWHQIAQTDEETLRNATQAYPSSNVHEWAEQAQKLAEKHGRTGALYTGPQPDDLTRIYGIGPVGAVTMYRIGICTYAQLAQVTPEQLAPHFPIAVAGDEPDFAHWIAQARDLAQEA